MKLYIAAMMLGVATSAPSLAEPTPIDPDAIAMLRSMSDYVGSLQSLQVAFDSDIEIITPQLEKIQFTNSGTATLVRPNKIRAHRIGGYSDVEMVYDGTTMSIHGKHVNGYAQVSAPGTVDDLIHALRAGHGVALPGSDLLVSNSYDMLAAGIQEAKYIGHGVIDGKDCEHLAFRNFDTDWQLWVRVGDKPAPCKMVITSKTINGAPQYTLRITDWKTDVSPPASTFSFTPPKGAQRLDHNALIELDELPQPHAEGAN